jgi:DNA-binding beta-propeller fold protein YncE
MRSWSTAVAVALALAFGAAPAQAVPFVYVTTNDGVFQYDIGAGGQLAPLVPASVAAGGRPIGVAVSPDRKNTYVANNYNTRYAFSISQYDIGASGALSPKNPPAVPTVGAPVAVAVSPDSKSVYVVPGQAGANGVGGVKQYDVGADGALSPKNPPAVPSGGIIGINPSYLVAVAVSPDGRSVYVVDFNNGVIWQYDVGADGTLSPKNPPAVDTGGFNPFAVAVSPDGKSVYVVNAFYVVNNNCFPSVAQYNVGPTGALSPKSPPAVAAGNLCVRGFGSPEGVAVSPDGKNVYAANNGGNVWQFDVGTDGALSPKNPPAVAGSGGSISVAVSPDSKSVYAISNIASGGAVAQYDVGAGGALSPKSPATVATGRSAYGVAVSPLGVPTRKGQCKNDGWRQFGFQNHGQCVAFVQRGPGPRSGP